MDEEEIDLWYEEQKDRLTENYRKKIDKSKNREKIKQNYNKALATLHKKYERISDKTIKHNLARFFFNYRFEKLKKNIFSPFIRMKEDYEIKKKKQS